MDYEALSDALSRALYNVIPTGEDLLQIGEHLGRGLRRGWDSERPSAAEPVEPYWERPGDAEPVSAPGSGYMTEQRLREEIARLEHRLQEAMERVEEIDNIEHDRDLLREEAARLREDLREEAIKHRRLAHLLSVERGCAPMGWRACSDGGFVGPNGSRVFRICPKVWGWHTGRYETGTAPTALEAIEAADAAILRGGE